MLSDSSRSAMVRATLRMLLAHQAASLFPASAWIIGDGAEVELGDGEAEEAFTLFVEDADVAAKVAELVML
jgi:hypothetical protein